ncbi:MAG TPA: hypothetical protein VIC55_10410, partial [Gemmatimonadaceae bacterium]|jgi:hypothetical protein
MTSGGAPLRLVSGADAEEHATSGAASSDAAPESVPFDAYSTAVVGAVERVRPSIGAFTPPRAAGRAIVGWRAGE